MQKLPARVKSQLKKSFAEQKHIACAFCLCCSNGPFANESDNLFFIICILIIHLYKD